MEEKLLYQQWDLSGKLGTPALCAYEQTDFTGGLVLILKLLHVFSKISFFAGVESASIWIGLNWSVLRRQLCAVPNLI